MCPPSPHTSTIGRGSPSISCAIADLDSFVEPLRRAGGVWLGGGLPENLLDTYTGTKVEQELRGVLARGGVVGGLSAGAMVLAGQTVNGSLGSDRHGW